MAMSKRDAEREAGAAIIIAVLGVIMLLALSGSMLTVWMANSRVITEAAGRTRAFYLSEAGLEEAKYELSHEQGGADGTIGTVSATSPAGSYNVTVANLGGGYWRFVASGESGGPPVTLEEVVQVQYSSRVPGGAISVVGAAETSEWLFDDEVHLFIDGGNSAAIVFSDPSLYAATGSRLATSVNAGDIAATDISGALSNSFQPGDVDLSLQLLPPAETGLAITADMYTDLRNAVQNVWMPTATTRSIPGWGTHTWGSAANPVNYKFPPGQRIDDNTTISGHGTLVFNRGLEIEHGGRLSWQGNVIVFADDLNDSFLDIGGDLDVTGNVLVIGGNGQDVRFFVEWHGECTVNGSLMVLTQFENPATKIHFRVEDDLTVNGLVTQVAPQNEIEFKSWNDVNINGSYQIARLDGEQGGTELSWLFEEYVEIHKDDAGIMAGAQALVDLGTHLGASILQSFLTRRKVRTVAWRVVPEGQG
jgi:hypothetical protein